MAYHTTSSTFRGINRPVTLGVKANSGNVTVQLNFSGAGSGAGAVETYDADGIYVLEPGLAEFTITANSGAVFELV
jgi:hypothetical protein